MASCIGTLKRVRDNVPNTALQSILNPPVQPHFSIIIVALPGTVAVQSYLPGLRGYKIGQLEI